MSFSTDLKEKKQQLQNTRALLEKANLTYELLRTGLFVGEASKALAHILEKTILEKDHFAKEFQKQSEELEALIAASADREPESIADVG